MALAILVVQRIYILQVFVINQLRLTIKHHVAYFCYILTDEGTDGEAMSCLTESTLHSLVTRIGLVIVVQCCDEPSVLLYI